MSGKISLQKRHIWTVGTVSGRVLQGSRTDRVCRHRKRFILRNWLVQLWRLAGPTSAEHTEARGGAGVAAPIQVPGAEFSLPPGSSGSEKQPTHIVEDG